MKYTECSSCQKTTIPITESIKIDGLLFCHACAQTTYPHEYLLEDKVVEQQFDPTICAFCKTDYGDLELPKTTKYPICADCQVDLDQRVFPSWVKAFFAGILLIVLLAFVWNWKYYQAYKNVRKANLYYVSGDYANATQSMTAASETVSEVSDLKTMATYFNGIDLLPKSLS